MTEPPFPDLGMPVLDSTNDFVRAISICAALEADTSAEAQPVLPYVGLARSAIGEYGMRLPVVTEDAEVSSFLHGLRQLDELVSRMMTSSASLTRTLRLNEAQAILREGREQWPGSTGGTLR